MKGKKIDTDFVAEFIGNCAALGKNLPEDICNEAKIKIENIDLKIKEVEDLKKMRSKLNDVIITLGKKVIDKSVDKIILGFYQISNLSNAFVLCDLVADSPIDIKSIDKNNSFIIKEMLAANILSRFNNTLIQGELYQDFIDFFNKRNFK